jgi:hypothetical protein
VYKGLENGQVGDHWSPLFSGPRVESTTARMKRIRCTRRRTCRCLKCRASKHTPTPAEIAAQCEAIRVAWTPTEHATRIVDDETRRVRDRQPVPECSTAGLPDQLRAIAWSG